MNEEKFFFEFLEFIFLHYLYLFFKQKYFHSSIYLFYDFLFLLIYEDLHEFVSLA